MAHTPLILYNDSLLYFNNYVYMCVWVYVSVTKFKLNYGHLEFVVYILLLFVANILCI